MKAWDRSPESLSVKLQQASCQIIISKLLIGYGLPKIGSACNGTPLKHTRTVPVHYVGKAGWPK